jgi:flagellar biogenesis protein FliO
VKKAVKAIEKAIKAIKPSRIIILKVRNIMQSSLGSKDQVKVEEVEDNRGVVPITIRRGRKVELLVRLSLRWAAIASASRGMLKFRMVR